jgi:hypothetical protein
MTLLTIISIVIGAGLGLRFPLIVLVPAICLAFAMVAVGGILYGESGWWIAIAIAVVATSLQLGFFGGFRLRLARNESSAIRRGKMPNTPTPSR